MGLHSNSFAPIEQDLYLEKEDTIQHPVSSNGRAWSHVDADECVLEMGKGFQYNILKTIAADRYTASKNGMQVPADPVRFAWDSCMIVHRIFLSCPKLPYTCSIYHFTATVFEYFSIFHSRI